MQQNSPYEYLKMFANLLKSAIWLHSGKRSLYKYDSMHLTGQTNEFD